MWKLTRYALAFIPIGLALVSPLSEPIKRKFANQYDLRWYLSQDTKERTQTIATYNDGNTALPKILIELDIPSGARTAVSDIDSPFNSHPRGSLLEALAHPNSLAHLANKPDRDIITAVLDDHSTGRTLYGIDNAFDDILLAKLDAAKVDPKIMAGFRGHSASHSSWLQNCEKGKPPHPQCKLVGSVLEQWEYEKRNFGREACRQWQQETGIELLSQGRRFSPDGKVPFSFALGADEARFLRIRYGPNAIKPVTTISLSADDRITQVDSVSDLRAFSLFILAKYHTLRVVFFSALILFFVLLVLPYAIPVKLRPVHKVFDLARRTNDYEIWEVGFQKHRHMIVRLFRELRDEYGRQDVSVSAEDLFDLIRYDLRREYEENVRRRRLFKRHATIDLRHEYGQRTLKYENEQQLNEDIRRHLRSLELFS